MSKEKSKNELVEREHMAAAASTDTPESQGKDNISPYDLIMTVTPPFIIYNNKKITFPEEYLESLSSAINNCYENNWQLGQRVILQTVIGQILAPYISSYYVCNSIAFFMTNNLSYAIRFTHNNVPIEFNDKGLRVTGGVRIPVECFLVW